MNTSERLRIAARFIDGDESAIERAFQFYRPALLREGKRHSLDEHKVEDAIQETFLFMLRTRSSAHLEFFERRLWFTFRKKLADQRRDTMRWVGLPEDDELTVARPVVDDAEAYDAKGAGRLRDALAALSREHFRELVLLSYAEPSRSIVREALQSVGERRTSGEPPKHCTRRRGICFRFRSRLVRMAREIGLPRINLPEHPAAALLRLEERGEAREEVRNARLLLGYLPNASQHALASFLVTGGRSLMNPSGRRMGQPCTEVKLYEETAHALLRVALTTEIPDLVREVKAIAA